MKNVIPPDDQMRMIKMVLNEQYEELHNWLWSLTEPDPTLLPAPSPEELAIAQGTGAPGPDRIAAIKQYKIRTKLSLRQAKVAVEAALQKK